MRLRHQHHRRIGAVQGGSNGASHASTIAASSAQKMISWRRGAGAPAGSGNPRLRLTNRRPARTASIAGRRSVAARHLLNVTMRAQTERQA